MSFRSFILAILFSMFIVQVFAQPKGSKPISLPAPVLKINAGGVFTETSWDLDLVSD